MTDQPVSSSAIPHRCALTAAGRLHMCDERSGRQSGGVNAAHPGAAHGPAPVSIFRTAAPYSVHAENIASADYAGDRVLGVVHAALMASETHRGNVLERRCRRAGVGVAVSGGTFYFAVVFID